MWPDIFCHFFDPFYAKFRFRRFILILDIFQKKIVLFFRGYKYRGASIPAFCTCAQHSVYHSCFQLDLYSHGLIGNFCSCTLSSLLNNKGASYSIDRLIENNLKRGFGGGEVVLSLPPPLDSSASAFDLY